MSYFAQSLSGRPALLAKLRVGATVAAGSGVMRDTNLYGEIIPIAVNGATDAMGIALEAATYDATPSVSESNDRYGGRAQCVINPDAVFAANVCGSATAATALTSSSLNYGTQTSASATVFTYSATFTTDYNGGSMHILTGANKGLTRVITSDVDSTSRTVTVAFPNSIAVGDTALMIPFSRVVNFGYFTTNFLELDGYTPDGSGAACRFLNVVFDTEAATAEGRFIFSDHWLNPESA